MAIKVYNSKFAVSNPEASRVKLTPKKLMGFSIAYCDNDETKARENFIGSMDMTAATANDNYITADYFGSMLLVDETEITQAVSIKNNQDMLVRIFPNPVTDQINLSGLINNSEELSFEVHSFTGELLKVGSFKTRNHIIQIGDLIPGMYLLTVTAGKNRQTLRFVK